jgi:hypothetical protein
MNRFEGSKYQATKNLGHTAITALIRKEFKALCQLWSVKVSVKKSGWSSIQVTLTPIGWNPFTSEFTELALKHNGDIRDTYEEWSKSHDFRGRNIDGVYSEIAVKLFNGLESSIQDYNYDASDPQSDYFSVRFYSGVRWSSETNDLLKNASTLKLPTDPSVSVKVKKARLSNKLVDYNIKVSDITEETAKINEVWVDRYGKTATTANVVRAFVKKFPGVPAVAFTKVVDKVIKDYKSQKKISNRSRRVHPGLPNYR